MSGLGSIQPIWLAPQNHTTSGAIITHAVADILGEVAFDPLSHNVTMASGKTSIRVHKSDTYWFQYLEAMPYFPVESRS